MDICSQERYLPVVCCVTEAAHEKEFEMKHQFTIDSEGDGWTIECSCGWSEWSTSETGALNLFGKHKEESAGEKTNPKEPSREAGDASR